MSSFGAHPVRMTTTFVIEPRGEFSLREAALFGFGPRDERSFDGVMRLAFCVDGYREQVGVELGQDDDGRVHGVVTGSADLPTVRAQVARVLSLDHDGAAFAEVGRRDPVIGRLQDAAPGLRPVLFYSPYEAAAWSVLSQRVRMTQAARLRSEMLDADGAFPAPDRLRDLRLDLPGRKLEYLHAVAEAALDGVLDGQGLRDVDAPAAIARVRQIKGLGPFAAELVVLRGANHPDAVPSHESRLDAEITEQYGPGATLAEVSPAWRPFRTWAAVHLRALREERTHEIGS
jgi:DNA-3-methyladenine glycosylase II